MARTLDDVYDKVVDLEIKIESHLAEHHQRQTSSRRWQDWAANLITGIAGGLTVWLAERFKIWWLCPLLLACSISTAEGQTTNFTLSAGSAWSDLTTAAGTNAIGAVNLAAYTLTLDGANTNYSCQSISASGQAGYIVLGNSSSAGMTLSAGSLICGTHVFLSLTNSHSFSVTTNYLLGSPSAIITLSNGSGTVSLSGGTIQGGGGSGAYAVYNNTGTLLLNGCTVISGTGTGSYAVLGNVQATNCNFVFGSVAPVSGSITILASNANNYVQFPTPTATVNFPAAATIMGPWRVTNSTLGTATSIGPWTIIEKSDGSFNVGPYPVR